MPEKLPTHKSALGHLGLFYAAAIWGATFFIVKGALDNVDPVTLVAYRFLMAGALLLPYVIVRRLSLLKDIKRAFWLGLLLWGLYVPQTLGLQYTTASNSGFITGLFVAFVPFFLLTIFRRKPTIMEIIASVVSLTGLWVLTGGMHDVNVGDMITLITAMTYALHLLYADKYLKDGMDPYLVSCQQFLIVGLLSLIAIGISGRPLGVTGTGHVWWTILFLAVFPTFLAFVIQMMAQRIIAPLRVSLVFALEPVFAGVFSWTLGGEAVVVHRAIGGLLIFIALVLSGLPTPQAIRAKFSSSNRS